MIFIFRQYDSQKQIIIYAESYLEAKETLFEFNPWADKTYNILEYKMYNIDTDKFWEVLNIDENGYGYPRIISKKEYEILRDNKVILDEQFKNIHNTKVLTKKFAGENTNLLSTEEFVGQLKNHAESVGKTKKSIYQMMRVVGDVWVKEFKIRFLSGCPRYRVYGKSRYQCEKFLNNLIEKTNINFENSWPTELLIKDFNDFTENDVSNYMMMIDYMKENNINKFPFSTYKEEEQ